MKSWIPEVIADASGQWCGNGLTFATEDEAYRWAHDLSYRWILVREYRAAPSDKPVSHHYSVDGNLLPVVLAP
jgi:hypothetical protein